MHLNYEWKAKVTDVEKTEKKLSAFDPLFIGEDDQRDTYFNVPNGRLKLREGKIENALIHYNRSDVAGAKQSNVILYQHTPDLSLKDALTAAVGIKVVVQKRRRIYFVNNVKFHFDRVEELGTFAEVEAIDKDGSIGIDTLKQQCIYWADILGIRTEDYLSTSYSDMLLDKKNNYTHLSP
jgi:predicted adenylyl cyclase CyaB